jgi:hypothetical protein
MREHNVNNLEDTVEVVQGGNGGIETRDSILSLCRNRILFACRICLYHLATRISNRIERGIHKGPLRNDALYDGTVV